ncbi:hypothetical protein [Rhodoferax sp.]|uniref:hypothetical protein n=1 Tax=Rhodoferax sp. TaxID=50421 RepID=UPI002767749E|nr:hypothetical protein [Rhodoferax sp.]
MIFDPYALSFVMLFLLATLGVALLVCKGPAQRQMLLPALLGFSLFNGFAVATVDAPGFMLVGYFLFIPVLIAGFRLGAIFCYPVGVAIATNAAPTLARLAEGRAAKRVISIYFILTFVTLIVPTFKVHLLLSPPSPDLRALFDAQFTVSRGAASAIIAILTALLTPMYYLALYRYRKKTFTLFLLIFLPLYMEYVRDAYIGRYMVFFALIYIFVMTWTFKARWRVALLVGTAAALPLLVSLAHSYTFLRLGAVVGESSVIDSILETFEAELMLPIRIGVPLIDSRENANLLGYFTWLFTMPIPGFIKDWLPVTITYLNHDISEVVLGVPRGARQFYIVLPGLIAESMFLYGKVFFVLHPLMIGTIIGGFAAITQNIPRSNALRYFLSILFFFNLNRGGIASVMPMLINGFLLFALIIYFAIHRAGRLRATHRTLDNASR